MIKESFKLAGALLAGSIATIITYRLGVTGYKELSLLFTIVTGGFFVQTVYYLFNLAEEAQKCMPK